MRDFTLYTYKHLLQAFVAAGYRMIAFEDYLTGSYSDTDKVVILRHDVDKRPEQSLLTAQIEKRLGVRASYYFRIVDESNKPHIIRQIAALGHEIGYHYEDMTLCKGDKVQALQSFISHLAYFRQFYSVRTCCMHGAPAHRYDGRDLWLSADGSRVDGGEYDYRRYGLIGEPYFDVDWRKVFYLTDTGGRWDGFCVSVRDKVSMQGEWERRGWVYHTTDDIVKALSANEGPFAGGKVMITTHPQRWEDRWLPWLKERVTQTMKNIVKRIIIRLGA
ncbi:MAG: hypothetical protein IJS00_00750 [Paludibacteraceae bacterium]|nr:hypothetical protein [Paludibacteraceae bacterium]